MPSLGEAWPLIRDGTKPGGITTERKLSHYSHAEWEWSMEIDLFYDLLGTPICKHDEFLLAVFTPGVHYDERGALRRAVSSMLRDGRRIGR
jgi:hypothetical protein